MLPANKSSWFSYCLRVLLLLFSGFIVIRTAFYAGAYQEAIADYHLKFDYLPETKLVWLSFLIYTFAFLAITIVERYLKDELRKPLLFSLWGLAIIYQLYLVTHYHLLPKVDLEHIYNQVMACLNDNNPIFSDRNYFGFYTNNIPVAILIYLVFAPFYHFFGNGIDYMVLGGIWNVICIFVSYVFIYRILTVTSSEKATFPVMLLLLTNPAFYAYAPYFYTDTLCLPFLTGGCLLLTHALKNDERKEQLVFTLIASIVLSLGYKIRATTIFLLIAFVVYLLIRRDWKRLVTAVPVVICGVLMAMLLVTPIERHFVPYDTKETAVPITHFLMMGSHDSGMYDQKDVDFTRSFATGQERSEATRQAFLDNLKKTSVSEQLVRIGEKEGFVWSLGSHWYQQYTLEVSEKDPVQELYIGKQSGRMNGFMQAYNLALFLFITVGLLISLIRREDERPLLSMIEIYYFGAVVFYMFWEAHPRHSLCFLPLLTILTIPSTFLVARDNS